MTLGAANSGDDPFAAAHDFFHSTGWYLFRNLAAAIAVAFWVASVWWVFRDARRRIDDPWIVAMATILALLPLVGPLLYLLVRPAESVADVRERELAMRALRKRIRTGEFCHQCGAESDPSYRFCPVCATELRRACPSCDAALETFWQLCPFCGTRSLADASAVVGETESFPELMDVAKAKRATGSAAAG